MEGTPLSIQEAIGCHDCFGCGFANPGGLRIKSYWTAPGETECVYSPEPHMSAGRPQILNGGIIATLIDCHGVCTAIADAYRREGREPGTAPQIWYVTGSLEVRYRLPAATGTEARVRARVAAVDGRKTVVACTLVSEGRECAEGTVVAIRVPGGPNGDGA